jgi:hypothetical protein
MDVSHELWTPTGKQPVYHAFTPGPSLSGRWLIRTVTAASYVEARDLLYTEMDKRYIKKDHYPKRQFCTAAIAKGEKGGGRWVTRL